MADNGLPVTQGTVTFREGNTILAGPIPVDASGGASFAIPSFSEGVHVVSAAYNGSPGQFNTSSGTLSQQVDNRTTFQQNGNVFTYCNPNTGGLTIPAGNR